MEKRYTETKEMERRYTGKGNTKRGNIERGYKRRGDKREMEIQKRKYQEETYGKERAIQNIRRRDKYRKNTNTKRRLHRKYILQGGNYMIGNIYGEETQKRRDYIWKESIWKGNKKENQLHWEGH